MTIKFFLKFKKTLRGLDIVFYLVIFCLALYLSLSVFKAQKKSGLVITTEFKTYELPLTQKEQIHRIKGTLGFTEVRIKDYKVRVVSSPCSGKNCIRAGEANLIICAPNKVTIRLVGKSPDFTKNAGEDFDALSR